MCFSEGWGKVLFSVCFSVHAWGGGACLGLGGESTLDGEGVHTLGKGEGVPTLDGGRGTYLGWGRGTYLGWGEGYLPKLSSSFVPFNVLCAGCQVGGHLKKGGKEDIFPRKGGQKDDIFSLKLIHKRQK